MTETASPKASLLEIDDVVKVYRSSGAETRANDHVSLSVERGRSLALVGESGSGKSTLAHIICGLETPDSGEVRILGTSMTKASTRKKREIYRHVQMVFQNPADSFNPRRKLGRSILDAAQNAGVDERAAAQKLPELLESVGLPASYTDRYPSQVSGGECQRAAIARAIAFGAELVVCDECTSALDVLVQSQIIELLNKLRHESDVSLLFICHDLAIVPDIADEVAVMLKGKVVEHGPAAEVIENPQHPYTQLMKASVFPTRPDTRWRIPEIGEQVKGGRAPLSDCPFYERCPQVKETCARELPEDVVTGEGHAVRCWNPR